jgi:quinolinate synthase
MDMTVDQLHEKLKHVKIGAHSCIFTRDKCEEILPLVNKINRIKKEKNAVILAHSYVAPEIVYGVADYRGDSYGLSKNALESDAETIVFVAVRFMGETAKILNPGKEVLIPGAEPGCSLADAINEKQILELKKKYPDHAFICYINTTAEVKAHCETCVTSSNVYDIIEHFPSDKIVFVPDMLMGKNILDEMNRRGVNKEIVLYDGTCYVHEEYKPEMIDYLKLEHPGMLVVSHPECTPEIAERSDFVGSTSQMMDFIAEVPNTDIMLLTECGLSSRLQIEHPEKNFIGTCQMCKYMKSNTLEDILRVLENPQEKDRVELSEEVIKKAKLSIDNMFRYAEMTGAVTEP